MTELSADKITNLDKIIDINDIERRVYGPVTMLQPKEGKEEAMYWALKNLAGHYKIYKKDELPERYHFKDNRCVYDLVMVADLGYTILTNDYKSRFLHGLPAETHGYDPNNEQMWALFMAHGPDFKNGLTVDALHNVNIYDLMAHLLHIQPAPNDGSLDSVKVMLKEK